MSRKRFRRKVAFPPWRLFVVFFGLVGLSAWSALFFLVRRHPPSTAALLLFLGLWFIALASSGTLLSWGIHRRLRVPLSAVRLVRQGLWVGTLGLLYALLQLLRTLTPLIALALAFLFVALESFLLVRTRS